MLRYFFIFFLSASPAIAGVFVPQKIGVIHWALTVAVVGDDGRKTEEDYAAAKGTSLKEVQNRFAASGVVECKGGAKGSAQLIGDGFTVVMSAHTFMDSDSCKKLREPGACKFIVRNGTVEQAEKISSIVNTGLKCPSKSRKADDWAVVKLRNPIRLAAPYKLPPYSDIREPISKSVISVLGRSIDFRRNGGQPKSIEDCETHKFYRTMGAVTLIESDCDSSAGSSGGALIAQSDDGVEFLFAITSSNNETSEHQDAIRRGSPPRQAPYSEDSWASYHIVLGGEFLLAVRRTVNVIR